VAELHPARAAARWWRRRGLRARVTLTAAAGLLIAIVAADLLLFNALRAALTRSVDDSARAGATQIVALIDENRLPNPVPVAEGTMTIQVLDPAGRILEGSPGADLLVPLLTPAQAASSARSGQAVSLNGPAFGVPAQLRAAAVAAANGDLVIAAVAYSSAGDSLTVVARALAFGTPLLFILFTGAIWLAVGSTLRPIALLRRGAAKVTATGVPRDLPVPEARDEVRSLALTLNDMLSRLAAAQQRQRDLVSDTAHELRSPIASIRTQLEVALDHPAGQDWAETARDVHTDVLRLARLAEDLLLLARLDEQLPGAHGGASGGPDGGPAAARRAAPVDLADLARSAVGRYAGARVPVIAAESGAPVAALADVAPAAGAGGARAAGARAGGARAGGAGGHSGSGDGAAGHDAGGDGAAGHDAGGDGADGRGSLAAAAPGACLVAGDRDSLDRLLVNLLDNAVRYAMSRVTVTVCRDGQWVVLAVTDDGPGIPAADMDRAFDRFARLDTARSRDGEEAGGAGLGLAIVRATARACGGTAHLEPAAPDSRPPGLRAVVRLPAGR
jgi:signal transduction histidine kinase